MNAPQLSLPSSYELLTFDEVDSTNEEAKRYARAGAREGILVWAERQTGGRGRYGRRWISPPGNLYMSLILKPNCPPSKAAQISFVTALAIGEAVTEFLPPGVRLSYKWPNDVLLRKKKVSGILLESDAINANTLDWLVVGIGVNVASSPAQLPFAATNLAAFGISMEVTDVLVTVANSLCTKLGQWRREGFAPIRESWLALAENLGEPIKVRLPSTLLEGRFNGLDDNGVLQLETSDHTILHLSTGDIFFSTMKTQN